MWFNIARNGASSKVYRALGEGVEAVSTSASTVIVRIKDRLSRPERSTPTGWADVPLNFYFVDDSEKHVVEPQFPTRR